MDAQFVMTIIAKDRPGLVESLARTVTDSRGNWLESRMARLGGQFAGILRVSIPAENADSFLGSIRKLENAGLKITVASDQAMSVPGGGRRAELKLFGQDRPGIVRQISEALARRGINVEELRTQCSSAPMTGETLFQTEAQVEIPANCSTQELRSEFEKIASDLMVDIKIHELPRS